MSTYYQLDQFAPSSPIIDVTSNEDGIADATGTLVIRVPSGVPIQGLRPQNLEQLTQAKINGLHARYPGFQYSLYDSCLTSDLVNSSSSGVLLASGGTNHCILRDEGELRTVWISLEVAPSSFTVVWEAYTIRTVDPRTGNASRVYLELPASAMECSIGFDGVAPVSVQSGATRFFTGESNSFVLMFTRDYQERVYLGSWAILYNGGAGGGGGEDDGGVA